jgi:SnoaL-like domain
MVDPTEFMTEVLHMWTNPDEYGQLDVIRRRFTTDVHFHDQDGGFEGESGLEAFSASLRQRFPTARFRLATTPDVVGDGLRAFWSFGPDEQPDAVTGMDFILWDGERANALYAFLTRPADAEMSLAKC